MHGALIYDSNDRVRPESFNSVVELLRDAATLSISENLGGNLIKSMSGTERKRIVDKYGAQSYKTFRRLFRRLATSS